MQCFFGQVIISMESGVFQILRFLLSCLLWNQDQLVLIVSFTECLLIDQEDLGSFPSENFQAEQMQELYFVAGDDVSIKLALRLCHPLGSPFSLRKQKGIAIVWQFFAQLLIDFPSLLLQLRTQRFNCPFVILKTQL